MSEIKVFDNSEFGSIRTIAINDAAWFVGKDVASILGYANPNEAIQKHIDEEDKLNSKTLSSFNLNLGQRGGWLINESGLYSLILSSKMPTAKKFKHWITSEVLPSIRKHGAYMTSETIEQALLDPDFLIRLANNLKIEKDKNRKLSAELECEKEKSENLTIANKVLSGDISSWEHKSIINALVRAYASRMCSKNFALAWNTYYKNLRYKQHINLKTRYTLSDKSKPKIIDLLKKEEIPTAIKVAAAMCEDAGIDIGLVINKINLAAVG